MRGPLLHLYPVTVFAQSASSFPNEVIQPISGSDVYARHHEVVSKLCSMAPHLDERQGADVRGSRIVVHMPDKKGYVCASTKTVKFRNRSLGKAPEGRFEL